MNLTLFWIMWAIYAAATVFYWRDFLGTERKAHRLKIYLLSTAVGVHLAFFVFFLNQVERLYIANVSEAMNSFVLFTALTYWLLEKRLNEPSMGTFILPVLLVLLAVSNILFAPSPHIAPVLHDYKFEIHVLCMLLAYGAFTLSFIASLLQYLLARELKKLSMGVFYTRLPSLTFFERISNAAVDAGLVFALLGLALGLYGANIVWDNLMLADPKFSAVLIIIATYGFHFISRKLLGWQGDRAAIISITGFVWILFSFLVISLVFTTQHQFR
ncbi:cytochrome c biogenesis protein CcsA [candidate division KSB1 bacterium]|nr:cytochrome c biogenesis protein CcsA [candidate division KSB1 bacterium]